MALKNPLCNYSGEVKELQSGDSLPGASVPGSSGDIIFNNAGSFGASLLRQTTNVIEQSNGANGQAFRLYNTVDSISSPTNYERGGLRWTSNTLEFFSEKGGTGTNRNLILNPGSGQVTLNTTGGNSLVINGNGVNNIFTVGWGGLQGVGMNENQASGFSLRIRGVSPIYALSFVSGNTNADSFYFGAQAGTSSTLPFVRMVSILAARPTLGLVKLTSQTGNLQQFTDTDGTTIFSRFNKDGYFMTLKNSAPADADLATNEMAIWFDSTAGAAKLMVKAKNASGTVVTGNIVLS